MGWVEKTNDAIAKSVIGRRFCLEFSGHKQERKGSRFLTEVRAGLATFFAMAYIVSVNAAIVSQSGGTCVCTSTTDPSCVKDAAYAKCKQEIQQDLVTATAAIASLTSFAFGALVNLPISFAPGMGLNTLFTFQVVGLNGAGPLSYRLALTAVFAEGLIMVALTLLGLRQWLARAIPASLKIACGAGIGLYLTLIGLSYSAGIGAVTGGVTDPLQLAGCVSELLDPNTNTCTSGQMRSPKMWIGIFGGLSTAILMMYRVRGALIFGILLVSIISWPRSTPVTTFPDTATGDSAFEFFKQVVTFHPIRHILAVQDWEVSKVDSPQGAQFVLTLLTFLYVDILDLTGTLYSMARFCGAINEETQDFEGSTVAYLVDAIGISFASLFGSPPVTAFVESGAGISEGGMTGITACVTGLCFFISIFFAPIFASIPSWATGCTLILVGAMMARAVTDINWRYMGDSVPAFLTLAIMPFTFSIAYGLITGIVTYAILNSLAWSVAQLSSGRIVPYDYEQADYWSPRIQCGIIPAWMKRLARGKRDFWREWNYDGATERSSPEYFAQQTWGDDRLSSTTGDAVRTPTTAEFTRSWEMPTLPILGKDGISVGASENPLHHLPQRSGHLDSVLEAD